MTSAPVDASRAPAAGRGGRRGWSAPAPVAVPRDAAESRETFSPARRVLPWALLLLVLSLVAIGYAVVLETPGLVTGALVLTATVLGAVAGLSVRDGRDRWVSALRALGDGARRLGRALWH